MSEFIVEPNPYPTFKEDGFNVRCDDWLIQHEEIVRCRDCAYYDTNDAPSEVYPYRYWCDRMTLYMPTDGFCSFGKRKVVGE